MFTLRCTQKLLTRLKVRPDPNPPTSTTKLGDWYANSLSLGRERLVLCVSEVTLLPVLVRAAGDRLDRRLTAGLRETLNALAVPKRVIDAELGAMAEVRFAKTANRRLLGTMNEFQFTAPDIADGVLSPLAIGLSLAKLIWGAIGYERPMDAAVEALTGTKRRSKPTLRSIPPDVRSYEEMVEAATVDAHGDAELATGWHAMIAQHLQTPFETEVLGVAVRVQRIELLDDLTVVAVCTRGQHRQTMPLVDLPLPTPRPSGAEWIEAFRRWRR